MNSNSKRKSEKINKSIEVATLQTIITDVRSLDDFVYATAVAAVVEALQPVSYTHLTLPTILLV